MTKQEHEKVLIRRAEKFRVANEARDDRTRQRTFERGMLSYDQIVKDVGVGSVDISDAGRGVRALTRQIDKTMLEARRFARMKSASAKLPRSCGMLRPLLWAIFRNGRNRRETMARLGISRPSYWRGLKFLLKFFQAQ